jgi:hypothetical protein
MLNFLRSLIGLPPRETPEPLSDEIFRAKVMEIVGWDEVDGRDIRQELLDDGFSVSLANFYSRMARMEDDGLVEGWYRHGEIDGVKVSARCYRRVDG